MPGFEDRLKAMRAKQEEGDQQRKQEEERQRAEALQTERKARQGELAAERERVAAELAVAETEAQAAQEAVAQTEAFMAEQGDKLDPEAKAEIDAIRTEAAQISARLGELRGQLGRIDAELGGTETAETPQAEAVAETPAAENAPATEVAVEAPPASEPTGEVSGEIPAATPESEEDRRRKIGEAHALMTSRRWDEFKAGPSRKTLPSEEAMALLRAHEALLTMPRSEREISRDPYLENYGTGDRGALEALVASPDSRSKTVDLYLEHSVPTHEQVQAEMIAKDPQMAQEPERTSAMAVGALANRLGTMENFAETVAKSDPGEAKRVLERAAQELVTALQKQEGEAAAYVMDFNAEGFNARNLPSLAKRLGELGGDPRPLLLEAKRLLKQFEEQRPTDWKKIQAVLRGSARTPGDSRHRELQGLLEQYKA